MKSSKKPPSRPNLVIDWGNSTLKVGWFEADVLIRTSRFSSFDLLRIELSEQAVGCILVSSTNQPASDIHTQLNGVGNELIVLNSQTPMPISNAYDTPATLGTDRVAAAVGASVLFPGQNCLVLDLGTCITADFIDQQAVFRGGLISPGLRMRFKAMHELTARLPLIDVPTDWPAITATNTQQAMRSGVMNGLVFELNGIIDSYRQIWPDISVLLCGGDTTVFESHLKPPIFAVPDLVLIGLNRILRYNVEHIQANTPDVNA